MTLWNFLEHGNDLGPIPDAHDLGRALRELHLALAEFDGELGSLRAVRDDIDRVLHELRPASWLSQKDIELLRSDLYELTPTVFETSLPAQPLHGDASLSNLLRTADGLIWNDLEDVCTGPVAWDLAGFIASLRADGQDQTFIDRVIVAYGADGLEGLGPFFDAHELYLTIWQSLVAQRRPGAPASVPERITRWRDHAGR